jgi:hypothetical protein
MADLDKTVTAVITFLIVAVIGLTVVSSLFGAIGVNESDLNVTVEDNGTAVGSGVDVELYDASDNTQIETKTTDNNSQVDFERVSPNKVYVISQTYQSDNITLNADNVAVTIDTTDSTTTVDSTSNDEYSGVFDDLENSVSSIYGLLLILPIVLAGAVAIGVLSKRMGRR